MMATGRQEKGEKDEEKGVQKIEIKLIKTVALDLPIALQNK